MTFKTTLDRTVLIITFGLVILFIVITMGQFSFLKDYMTAGPFFAPIIFLIVFLIGYFNRVSSYRITNNDIVIQRSFSKRYIPLEDIKTAEVIDQDKIKVAFRVYGIGGLFGYYGQFENKTLGRMTWYITRKDNLVLIQTIYGQKIVLSPNHPQQFIDLLHK